MRKVLVKDLVIPAGTIFDSAPTKTERHGDGCVQAVIGLSKNTYGTIEYWCDDDEAEVAEYFRDVA